MSTSSAAASVTADDVAAFYRQHEGKDRLPPAVRGAGIIRHQLEQTRERQRAQEFFARMRRGLDIQIDRAVLERVELPVRNEPPPAIPGLYAPQAATRN